MQCNSSSSRPIGEVAGKACNRTVAHTTTNAAVRAAYRECMGQQYVTPYYRAFAVCSRILIEQFDTLPGQEAGQ